MTDPLVSIVIPTYERPEALVRCLDSIATTVHVPHEIVCVSVGNDDATNDVLRGRDVTHVEQEARQGFVHATNLGLRAATGTWIVQLNDDCTLLPHTLENAIRFLNVPAHARIGVAAFFHDSPVRRNIAAQIQVDDIWYYVCHVRGLCYANYGLARRSLYEQLGHFDDRYFMYGADPDFCLKVWHEAKLEVRPCPGALVHHEQLNDPRATYERATMHEDNQKLFAKWNL